MWPFKKKPHHPVRHIVKIKSEGYVCFQSGDVYRCTFELSCGHTRTIDGWWKGVKFAGRKPNTVVCTDCPKFYP